MQDVLGMNVDQGLDDLPHIVLDLRLGDLGTGAQLLLQILGKRDVRPPNSTPGRCTGLIRPRTSGRDARRWDGTIADGS